MGQGKNAEYSTNVGLTLGGGLLSAYNTYKQGKEEQEYYNQLAAANEANATNIQIATTKQLVSLQKDATSFMNTQRTAAAASGVTGQSVNEVVADTAAKSMLDQLTLKENAANQVHNLYYEAGQNRLAGVKARKAAATNTVTSLLGTAQKVSDIWYQWQKKKE
jgi:hypothetical protein